MRRGATPGAWRDPARWWRAPAPALLVLVALVAGVRAQGVPIEVVDTRLGKAVYSSNCAACHQVTGTGLRAAVPPLAGNVPALMGAAGGREYLISAVLFGVAGELSVAGESYDGLMPSWHHLRDEQLAALLNYIATDWHNVERLPGGTEAFTPLEVALARADAKTSAEAWRARPDVDR